MKETPNSSILNAIDQSSSSRQIFNVDAENLSESVVTVLDANFRLALCAAHDDDSSIRIVYAFTGLEENKRLELHLRVTKGNPTVNSIAALSFPGARFEREMRDQIGIELKGHPQPMPLVKHSQWPSDWWPLRKDSGESAELGDETKAFPFLEAQGKGVYEIPVGPVHAGLIEPGHFRFSAVGEKILAMQMRLWFLHRGMEKLFEGLHFADAVSLTEQISGDSAVGHSLSFCRAIEEAYGIALDKKTEIVRAILLEFERLYTHIADIGMICNDVAYGIANAHASRIREQLLRINKTLTGHRLLRGSIFVGGARINNLCDENTLNDIARDVDELCEIALTNSMVMERLNGTSPLPTSAAIELGTLGYVARASNLSFDARKNNENSTFGLYDELNVVVESSCDVLARFQVRRREFAESVKLINLLSSKIDAGSFGVEFANELRTNSGLGVAEGWRGTIVHRAEINSEGILTRLKIVDPSFMNWPALPISLKDTIVPDFPLTNKSFNLSYAGNDL